MRFEDIKTGETVFLLTSVNLGYGLRKKVFFIPKKVTKTTKTQFTLEDGKRYKKSTGREIGGNGGCYPIGSSYFNRPIKDDSAELLLFIKKKNAIVNLNALLSVVRLPISDGFSMQDLSKLTEDLEQFKKKYSNIFK